MTADEALSPDGAVTLDSRLLEAAAAPPELVERLRARAAGVERYRMEGEVGRAMGRALCVWDPLGPGFNGFNIGLRPVRSIR